MGLAAYVDACVFLSALGKPIVVNHGGSDWDGEWCQRMLVRTYFAFSGRQKACLTPIGMLFWPCLAADRLLWHRIDHQPGY